MDSAYLPRVAGINFIEIPLTKAWTQTYKLLFFRWGFETMQPIQWAEYRVKYLVRATQLTEPCQIVGENGDPEMGEAGDYLVHYSDGTPRVVRRRVFEGLYTPLEIPAR